MTLRNKIEVNGKIKGLGYLKSYNSHKDFSLNNEQVKPLLQETVLTKSKAKLFTKRDLRKDFTPVKDQGSIGSCTAFSVAALVEYMQKRAYGKYTPISTLFTYKTTRNLLFLKGDTGAYMRSVLGSIALFGSPPEEYYEYDGREEALNTKFDKEPPAFCYAFAQAYQGLKYLRLDQPNTTPETLIHQLKLFLTRNYPVIFGFTCFDSLYQAYENGGFIPFPSTNESIVGGHAVCLAGYDDSMMIKNSEYNIETKGAFLFKNSWGTDWGDKGYGWIPYDFFLHKLADDCWTITKQEWIDHMQFQE